MYTIKLKDSMGFELKSVDLQDNEFNDGKPISGTDLQKWAQQAAHNFGKSVIILKNDTEVAQYSLLNDLV